MAVYTTDVSLKSEDNVNKVYEIKLLSDGAITEESAIIQIPVGWPDEEAQSCLSHCTITLAKGLEDSYIQGALERARLEELALQDQILLDQVEE